MRPEHEFPTAPLASGLRRADGGAVENSAAVVHYLKTQSPCLKDRSHLTLIRNGRAR